MLGKVLKSFPYCPDGIGKTETLHKGDVRDFPDDLYSGLEEGEWVEEASEADRKKADKEEERRRRGPTPQEVRDERKEREEAEQKAIDRSVENKMRDPRAPANKDGTQARSVGPSDDPTEVDTQVETEQVDLLQHRGTALPKHAGTVANEAHPENASRVAAAAKKKADEEDEEDDEDNGKPKRERLKKDDDKKGGAKKK